MTQRSFHESGFSKMEGTTASTRKYPSSLLPSPLLSFYPRLFTQALCHSRLITFHIAARTSHYPFIKDTHRVTKHLLLTAFIMSLINNSDQESPFEVVTPISTPKPKRALKSTPKATPMAAGDGNGAGNDQSENISLAEGRLLIEMLSAVCENSTGTKFNWAAISDKLGLPSAGAT